MSRIIFLLVFLLPLVFVQESTQTADSSTKGPIDAEDEFYKIMDDFQDELEELSPDDIIQFDMQPSTQEVIIIEL